MKLQTRVALVVAALVAFAATAPAKDLSASLKRGKPDIQAIGAMAFAPEGILLVGDPKAGAVFAIGTGDTKPEGADKAVEAIENVNEKIASLLGIESKQLRLGDMAVNPASQNMYLGVMRGMGKEAQPALVRITRGGKLSVVDLTDVPFAKTTLAGAKVDDKMEAITCLAFVKNQVIVAGMSNEEFASTLRAIPFPFPEKADAPTAIKIFHGAHGKFETQSPVRAFTTYETAGTTYVLAGYLCTPLVRIPLGDLKPGAKVTGTTIAELGNRNRPLDMVVYQKDGKDYLLVTNNARGVMKFALDGIDKVAGLEAKVDGGGTAGVKFEKIEALKDVQQLSRFDDKSAVVITQAKDGPMNLRIVALP